jgi:transposase
MLSLPSGIKIYIGSTALDMRKSFDAMSYHVTKELQHDVYTGGIYVFCNKRGDKSKLFYWDRNGYCCWYKRLERGVFRLPRVTDKVCKVSVSELNLLLEGIELTHRQRLQAC